MRMLNFHARLCFWHERVGKHVSCSGHDLSKISGVHMLGETVAQHVLGGDPFHQGGSIFRRLILKERVAVVLTLLAPNSIFDCYFQVAGPQCGTCRRGPR